MRWLIRYRASLERFPISVCLARITESGTETVPTVSAARAAFVAGALALHAAPFTSPAARVLHILYSLHTYICGHARCV